MGLFCGPYRSCLKSELNAFVVKSFAMPRVFYGKDNWAGIMRLVIINI